MPLSPRYLSEGIRSMPQLYRNTGRSTHDRTHVIRDRRRSTSALSALILALLGLSSTACQSFPIRPLTPTEPAVLRVATMNIRAVNLDLEDPAVRGTAVAEYLLRHQPEIVFLQEAAAFQDGVIIRPCPLASAIRECMDGYGWIRPTGVSVLSGSNPILYRESRFMPVRQGIVWMSDTPEIPDSRTWGNDIPRYATWALLYDVHGGRHVFVANVHLDHLSQATNRRSAELLIKTLAQEARQSSTILAGDFNSAPIMRTRRLLARELHSALEPRDGPTYSSFPRLQIDGVYYSDDFVLDHCIIDRESARGPVGSDHAAVWADLLPKPDDRTTITDF
jgi:endonuclease/exonuclease/phosphatase family metal-dependent hydrolase